MVHAHRVRPDLGPSHARAQQYTSLASIRYAHATWQIFITIFLWQVNADRTERDVFETIKALSLP